MIITIQEETLAVKYAFEIWASTLGVKIHRYHAENGRFSEQHFKTAIEDSNQTTKFCGVVSHHKITIVEIKIKNITLRDRKSLLHAKRYFTESMTTMLWT